MTNRVSFLLFVFYLGAHHFSLAQDSTSVRENFRGDLLKPIQKITEDKSSQVKDLESAVKSTMTKSTAQVPDSIPDISRTGERMVKDKIRDAESKVKEQTKHLKPDLSKEKLENALDKPIEFRADENGNNLDELRQEGGNAVKGLNIQEGIDPASSGEQIIRVDPVKELDELNVPSLDEIKSAAATDNRAANVTDAAKKVLSVDGMNMFGVPEPPDLENATKVYSEKLIRRIKDSLDVDEANKIVKAASALTKKQVSQEEYMKALSQVAPEKTVLKNVNVEEGVIQTPDQEKFDGLHDQLQTADLSSIQLPDSVLSELEPLRNYRVPEKYAKLADSLRHINFSKADMELEEKKITEETKAAIARKKPKFFDHLFAEMVIGYLRDGNVNLYQASPTLSYYLTQRLSVGAGPTVLFRTEEKELDLTFGFRGLVKMELMKQRAYLQLEDNVEPGEVNAENIGRLPHTFLGGAGVLLPISNRIAINACLLHRLNTSSNDRSSPWVFRLGISSFKIK